MLKIIDIGDARVGIPYIYLWKKDWEKKVKNRC